ncbi:cell division ATP-binding protein FtsE [Corynebacterium maris DSM 45190]|uniref:Cell division ATP-binding protein FtsE n=1 Tax=Corynebacterium maris DSM 45190 TaxID=1224163 RepID=S5TH19_9CORY|nr:cell division ATP-binding protein FtsE [Corynebacterium maris]AGS34216.1 cell division ATP-binding protein FtsE [Corynebacterium maris DSM 45190]
MITFESVTKIYEDPADPALHDLSLSIGKGEFVFLIGPSGSGKSTFLNLLIREESPSSGDIRFADFHVNRLRGAEVARMRRRIGYVFQDFRLLPKLTVYDNVAFALRVIGKNKRQVGKLVPEALEMVGLAAQARRLPHELSGGEQQRVAVARAVVNRPLLLLADEPTGNLDPETAEEIMALLTRINRDGTTVIMSTHNARAVNAMRQRVLELRDGELVRDDAHGSYTVGSN